jgi:hypothetical protein
MPNDYQIDLCGADYQRSDQLVALAGSCQDQQQDQSLAEKDFLMKTTCRIIDIAFYIIAAVVIGCAVWYFKIHLHF